MGNQSDPKSWFDSMDVLANKWQLEGNLPIVYNGKKYPTKKDH